VLCWGLLGDGAPSAAGEGCLAVGGHGEARGHTPGAHRAVLPGEPGRLQERDVQVCGEPSIPVIHLLHLLTQDSLYVILQDS